MSATSDRTDPSAGIVRPEESGRHDKHVLSAVARGGLANLLGAGVSVAATFAITVVVARLTTTDQAGYFFTLTSLFLVVEMLCRLGADTGLVYFVARWRALDQFDLIRRALRTALLPVLAVSAAAGCVLVAIAPWVAVWLTGAADGHSVALVRLFGVLVPVAVAYDLALAATRGFGRMRPTVLFEKMIRPLLQLSLILLVIAAGWGHWAGLAWVMPYLVVCVLVWLTLVRDGDWRPSAPEAVKAQQAGSPASFWGFTGPRAVAGVAQILLQRLDILLVAGLAGAREAAIYTAATRFLVVGQFVNQAITAPVQPELSTLFARGHTDSARTLYRVSTTWLVLLTWPLFCVAIVLAPTYLHIFGHGYRQATNVVIILAAAMLVANVCGLVDTVIIMAGRTSWNLITTVAALVVNVALDLALIPQFGVVGAAIGWSAAILTANILPLLISWRFLQLHPYGRSTVQSATLAAICFLLVPLGVGAISGGDMTRAAALAAGSALYAWLVWRKRRLFELDALLRRRTAREAPT